MNYKVNPHQVRDIKKKAYPIKLNNGLTLKCLSLIIIVLLSFLLTPNVNFTEKILNKIEHDQLIKKDNLKTNNQGDSIFKLSASIWLYGQSDLDPHDSWATEILNQVYEGLFYYNLSDPQLAIIPNLANGTYTWSPDNLNFTVGLRENITFHDGTKFNASAVKWSFDRLAYFMNSTGQVDYTNISQLDFWYKFEDGTFIINRTEIINEYEIKFVLNKPFAGLQALLCFQGSYILSPASTPQFKYINSTTGDLVGTGPFEFDSFEVYGETKFHAYENYWRGKPQIEILRLVDLGGSDRAEKLQSGEIDLVNNPPSNYFTDFESDPNINLVDVGKTVSTYYLGMNNKIINNTWRQAISYAINYSYITDIIMEGSADRLKSPIPENIMFGNSSMNTAIFNVSKAREIMQSMGFGFDDPGKTKPWDTTYPGNNETDWTNSTLAFISFNFSYSPVNWYHLELLPLLQNNLSLIGINVTDANLTVQEFLNTLWDMPGYSRNNLQLFPVAWIPDYNDPSNYINTLFSNTSVNNIAQVNDPYIQNLIDNGMNETDSTARKVIYDEIQKYAVENLTSYAFMFTPRNYDAYYNYILGYQSNPLDFYSFYEVSQNSTFNPGKIYIDGNLEWSIFKNMSKCTGFGNSTDPYIIRDLVIDGDNRSRSCIIIEDSDVNFVIENCTVFNSLGAGIELINLTNSEITESNCSNNKYGIILEGANNSLIFNNFFTNNVINAIDNGSSNSWDNGIIGNYWDDYGGLDEDDDGIGDSPYTISGTANSQDNLPIWHDDLNTYCVYYISGDYSIENGSIEVDLNVILNITVEYLPYLTNTHISSASVELQGTTFTYNFIEDLIHEQYTLLLNTGDLGVGTHNINLSAQKQGYTDVLWSLVPISVNEAPETYIIDPIIIDGTGKGNYTWDDAVEHGWCTGSGTEEDPYVIESLEIDGQNSESCLIIRESTAFVVIESSIFSNAGGGINEAGLKLENVSNIILNNINCSNNNANGILLLNCQNITITSSTFNHNEFAGIFLNRSSFNFVIDNTETINHNYWGIYLLFSHNNSILRNSIGYNVIGLFFNNSNFNTIINNIFRANQEAIVIDDKSTGNHVEGNTIITKTEFPTMIVIVSIIGGIIGISGVSTALILKKKVFIPKAGKEIKVFSKKKTKIENKLEERLSYVDHLIRGNKIKDAIKNLNEIKDLSETYGLVEILNTCEENLMYCTNLYSDIINKIKKTVLDLSTKFARLQTIDISEKTEIPDEELIISVIQEMIRNNEIFAEYFSSSKAIAFDQQKNLEKLEGIVSIYTELEPEEMKKFNVFLSYSTSDSDFFDMPRIVTSLENYPDIDRVLYWEADSRQNIVEFMDDTLKKCNVFILFCSENSIKSAAVKDEWQAAFQRRKKELLKMIPVYEAEEHVPPILGHLLNVKFDKEDFNSFIEKLHHEIQR